MCNGDLGMYRVMPWAYPTIPGQSSGGTTVDPTPEPTPDLPLDFSNAKFTIPSTTTYVGGASGTDTYVTMKLNFSGIKVNNSTNVSNISFTALGNPSVDPLVINGVTAIVTAGTYNVRPANIDKDGITSILSARWKKVAVNGTVVNATGITGISITVYSVDGSVLQTFEGVLS